VSWFEFLFFFFFFFFFSKHSKHCSDVAPSRHRRRRRTDRKRISRAQARNYLVFNKRHFRTRQINHIAPSTSRHVILLHRTAAAASGRSFGFRNSFCEICHCWRRRRCAARRQSDSRAVRVNEKKKKRDAQACVKAAVSTQFYCFIFGNDQFVAIPLEKLSCSMPAQVRLLRSLCFRKTCDAEISSFLYIFFNFN
jgi:hypothetical protein